MSQENPKDGSSGRLLVIWMVTSATILSIIAAIYTHYYPPVDPTTVPATTQSPQ
jgi:hypothetical protein